MGAVHRQAGPGAQILAPARVVCGGGVKKRGKQTDVERGVSRRGVDQRIECLAVCAWEGMMGVAA